MDANSENLLSTVHPQLAEKIRTLSLLFTDQYSNDTLRVVQGLRSWQDQEKLWNKGRDETGTIVDPAVVVTNAPPGHSWHEYGLAVDVCPSSLLQTPSWSPDNPEWEWMGKSGESLGLVWGGRWTKPDKPHFQLTGTFPVSPSPVARILLLTKGIDAVWAESGITTA